MLVNNGIDDEPLDVLTDRHYLVDGETPPVAGTGTGPAADGPVEGRLRPAVMNKIPPETAQCVVGREIGRAHV